MGAPELVPGSEAEPDVAMETGAVLVTVNVAAAPAAPDPAEPAEPACPDVGCGNELDVRVENATVCEDENATVCEDEIKWVLAVKLETVLVVNVVLEYGTLAVDAAVVGVVGVAVSEELDEPEESEGR